MSRVSANELDPLLVKSHIKSHNTRFPYYLTIIIIAVLSLSAISFILLRPHQNATKSTSFSLKFYSSKCDGCNEYKCIENMAHCGPNGYLLHYGLHFCSRFYEYYQRFDSIGQAFIDCVRPKLLDYLKANIVILNILEEFQSKRSEKICASASYQQTQINATTCAEIEEKAFASHSNVYTNCDFCQAFITNALAFSDVLWNRESNGSQMVWRQITRAAAGCGDDYLKEICANSPLIPCICSDC